MLELFLFTFGAGVAGYIFGFWKGVDFGMKGFFARLPVHLRAMIVDHFRARQK